MSVIHISFIIVFSFLSRNILGHEQHDLVFSTSKKIAFSDLNDCQAFKGKNPTVITLSDESTIAALLRLADLDKKNNKTSRIVAVNFANAYHPGGAQEGSLRRATTLEDELHKMIRDGHYPIQDNELFISENVLITHDDTGRYLEIPVRVDIISVPAVDLRENSLNNQEYQALMYEKIRAQIKASIQIGADTLVVGAFGCGVFGGDPEVVAKLYQKAVKEIEGSIPNIHFSIYGGGKNLVAFEKIFKKNETL